jgi:hypothetical protein
LPETAPPRQPHPADVSRIVALDLTDEQEFERRFSGPSGERATLALGAGETVEVSLGRAKDVLQIYDGHATFLIEPQGAAVWCATAEPEALAWQRVLLDTVLGTAALCHGLEALHGAAVELPGGVVAVIAPSGGGKSTLCVELILRGGRLFTDDLVFLTRDRRGTLAHPGPPLMNVGLERDADVDGLGDSLAVFGEERWVAVRDAARDPQPLRALVLLDRRRSAQSEARLEPEASALAIIGAALDSGPWIERRRARFELLADLVRDTPVLRLVAGVDVPPAALAELVESAMDRAAGS